jgi:hypothetical protein
MKCKAKTTNGRCFQTVRLEGVPGTAKEYCNHKPNGAEFFHVVLNDLRPAKDGLCYYHSKLKEGYFNSRLVEPGKRGVEPVAQTLAMFNY